MMCTGSSRPSSGCVHDQGYGRGRLMSQCTGVAADGDGIGTGLRALLLTASASTIASSSTTRGNQQREQKYSEKGNQKNRLCVPPPAFSGRQHRKSGQRQPQCT